MPRKRFPLYWPYAIIVGFASHKFSNMVILFLICFCTRHRANSSVDGDLRCHDWLRSSLIFSRTKQSNKQSSCMWFETLWRFHDIPVMVRYVGLHACHMRVIQLFTHNMDFNIIYYSQRIIGGILADKYECINATMQQLQSNITWFERS